MPIVTLQCPSCCWKTKCDETEKVVRLRKLGLLRRESNPSPELVSELLTSHVSHLVCDACGKTGLSPCTSDDADLGDDWQQAVLCQLCHQPIDPERLEIFPNVRRCKDCQERGERGDDPVEPEYCSKCGALVELRVSRGGGVTRYKRFCTGNPPCRL